MRLAGVHQTPKDDMIRHRSPNLGPNLLAIRLRLIRVTNKVVNGPIRVHGCVSFFENRDECLWVQAAPSVRQFDFEFSGHSLSPENEVVD